MIEPIMRALAVALAMGWEILWPLILGFALSASPPLCRSPSRISRSQLLPDDRPRSIATALALGAASSSCSYAAVALSRSIFRKGAHFTAAMAFEMASTNLVLELSIIMVFSHRVSHRTSQTTSGAARHRARRRPGKHPPTKGTAQSDKQRGRAEIPHQDHHGGV